MEQKKKYRLMPKFEGPKSKPKEVKFDFQSSVPSKLNPAVQDLLQELVRQAPNLYPPLLLLSLFCSPLPPPLPCPICSVTVTQ